MSAFHDAAWPTPWSSTRRAALFYGPLLAESDELLGVFKTSQLEIITEFIRRERGLLTRHTARAQKTLASGGPVDDEVGD